MTASRTLLYVRTPQGRALAFSPDTKLLGPLKAMLKAIDGKITVAELMVQFADADAAGLVEQLHQAGLIKLREDRAGELQNPASPPTAAPAEPVESAVPRTGLSLIVDVMSTFVLTHFPLQAFTVLAKLESFKTLAELEAELPDYSVLARASGPAGLEHLAEVTERVREAAAA